MIRRLGDTIEGEVLELPKQSVIHNCCVVDCELYLPDPREVGLQCSEFKNTTIKVARTNSEQWTGCFFDSCTIKGKFYDCLFGNECDQCPRKRFGLRNCDFTGATLNFCWFLNCTPDDLKMPTWPCVTIVEPAKNAADFADLTCDPLLEATHRAMEVTSPEVVAVSYHFPSYLRKSRSAIMRHWKMQKLLASGGSKPEPVLSLENARELLKTKPYVFM